LLVACRILGFHSGGYEEYHCLLVFAELISSTLKMEAICSSETSVETRRTTRRYIPEDDTLVSSLFTSWTYASILKMEAVSSAETSVNYQTTQHNISEDSSLHSHRRGDLISYKLLLFIILQILVCSLNPSCRTDGVQFRAGTRHFPLLHSVQTSSGVHPDFYPMGTGGSFPGSKAAWP
jgi:hypothetical protein